MFISIIFKAQVIQSSSKYSKPTTRPLGFAAATGSCRGRGLDGNWIIKRAMSAS
jgi:hypothetical protein